MQYDTHCTAPPHTHAKPVAHLHLLLLSSPSSPPPTLLLPLSSSHSPHLLLRVKMLGQVEADHNDRPVDDVTIKKASVLMQ